MTQTIRDGQSGEVLSRSTFTAAGVVPEAIVQPAFAPALPLAVTTTIEAAALLLTVLSARQDGFGTVLGMSAQRYEPGAEPSKDMAVWVGPIGREALNDVCQRNPEVLSVTNSVTARVKAASFGLSPQRIGDMIHLETADHFRKKDDPDLVPELSLDRDGSGAWYGSPGSVRLDLHENNKGQVACVYDYKTGKGGLTATRAILLATIAKRRFPSVSSVIIIQVRPKI